MLMSRRGVFLFLIAAFLVNFGVGSLYPVFAENVQNGDSRTEFFKLKGDYRTQVAEVPVQEKRMKKTPLPGHETGTFKPDIILRNTIQLSLKDVIQETLKNNVAIAVQNYTNQIREQNIITNESEFDLIFNVDLKATDDTIALASAFSIPQVEESDSQNWTLGLNQKLYPGTEYEFKYLGPRQGREHQGACDNRSTRREF